MAALTAATPRKKFNYGGKKTESFTVASGGQVYGGGLVNLVHASGQVAAASDSAGHSFVGMAEHDAAAGETVKVAWDFEIEIAATAAADDQADVGVAATVSDDNTVDVAAGTTNDVNAGYITKIVGTQLVRVMLRRAAPA